MNPPDPKSSSWRGLLKRWPGRVLISLLILSGLLVVFVKMATDIKEGETTGFDRAILMSVRDHDGNLIPPVWLAEVARDITALGSIAVLALLVTTLVAFFLIVGRRFEAIFLSASVIGGSILSNVLKIGLDRPRPVLPDTPAVFSASFPSGHATMSAVIFLTIGAILAWAEPERRLEAFFMLVALCLTLLVGVSRVYLGLHYPTDVIAGWCVGSAWAIGCSLMGSWIRSRSDSGRAA